jgi:hypothetical protein
LTSRKQAQTRDYASAGSCVFALGHRFSADASALSKSQAEISLLSSSHFEPDHTSHLCRLLDWLRSPGLKHPASSPGEPQLEIDGVHAVIVWLKGQPIAVVNGWDIATGRGWIEKAEDWAKKHRALLYDTEGGFDEAILAAVTGGYGIVVVRQFKVRD